VAWGVSLKARLLLVEDSEAQGKELISMLERLGYSVVWARTGVEGLRLMRGDRPDLVLLDVVLSDLDGFAVCRWMKVTPETKDIPVIMLTAKSSVSDRVEGLHIGADDYIGKPFAPDELEARIFAQLRGRAANTELKARNQELETMLHRVEALALTDPLTGLFNRRRFADVLKREFAITKRYKNPLSCLMMDVDHFKQLNDRFTHDAGDEVLKHISNTIVGGLREVDLPSRYGGEELAILLPQTPKDNAMLVAERLLDKIRAHVFTFGTETVTVTVSIGVAASTDVPDGSPEDLVKAADVALYDAKSKGRNRVASFTK